MLPRSQRQLPRKHLCKTRFRELPRQENFQNRFRDHNASFREAHFKDSYIRDVVDNIWITDGGALNCWGSLPCVPVGRASFLASICRAARVNGLVQKMRMQKRNWKWIHRNLQQVLS